MTTLKELNSLTTIKEFSIQSVAEPYGIKIERGQKGGYGYELSVKSDNAINCIEEISFMRKKIEEELYGNYKPESETGKHTSPV